MRQPTKITAEYGKSAVSLIDRFLCLAGLHHIDEKTPIYSQITRVLTLGGIAVIADTHADSNVAKFLDECVHKFKPNGAWRRVLVGTHSAGACCRWLQGAL